MNVLRASGVLAALALTLVACAQVLGIEDIHDDPADAAPGDALVGSDAPPDAFDSGTDSSKEAASDAGVEAESGPDPALGCPAGDAGYTVFLPHAVRFYDPITIDPLYVYAASGNGIYRCSVEGCTGTLTTITVAVANDIGANGRHIIWSDSTGAGTTHVSTPDAVDVASRLGAAHNLAVGGDDIYVTSPSGIEHLYDSPTSIDASAGWLVTPQGSYLAIAASAHGVAYTSPDDAGATTVFACPPVSCPAPAAIAHVTLPANSNPGVLVAVDDTNVYWSDPGAGTVESCPLAGCSGPPRTVVQGGTVTALHVDAKGLYWALDPGTSPRIIYRGPTDGGPPAVVASTSGTAVNLAANDKCVYWSTPGSIGANIYGSIMAAPQP